MNEGGGNSLQVRQFYRLAKIPIELRSVSGRTGFSKMLEASSQGMDSPAVLIWGKREVQKIKNLPPIEREGFIRKEFQKIACCILADRLPYPLEAREIALKRGLALFTTRLSENRVKIYLRELFFTLGNSSLTLSGGLLQIFGIGVLILGDSGMGKSESALELISRGHLFISDDVVQIDKDAEGNLNGYAIPLSRNFMEIRGLGIINIAKIFGKKSIRPKSKIDLVIMLKKWEEGKEYDRLGLEFPETQKILGAYVPKISIPVAPGRNICTLIEVACKVFQLKQEGYLAAREISEKLERALAHR
jgi:HPr kinase/phosphorylase